MLNIIQIITYDIDRISAVYCVYQSLVTCMGSKSDYRPKGKRKMASAYFGLFRHFQDPRYWCYKSLMEELRILYWHWNLRLVRRNMLDKLNETDCIKSGDMFKNTSTSDIKYHDLQHQVYSIWRAYSSTAAHPPQHEPIPPPTVSITSAKTWYRRTSSIVDPWFLVALSKDWWPWRLLYFFSGLSIGCFLGRH